MRQIRPDKYRNFIRRNSVPVTVYRRDDADPNQYGQSLSYTELPESRDLLIAGLQEVEQGTMAGEIQSGAVTAYTLPEEDFGVNDRIDHGGSRLEVVASYGLPSDNNPAITRHELEDI